MSAEKLKDVLKNLEEAGVIIAKLDPAIRPAAFELLRPFLIGQEKAESSTLGAQSAKETKEPPVQQLDTSSLENFFGGLKDTKPADNVVAIMAWHYSQKGVVPISIDDVQKTADKVGLTVPARIDMTLTNGRREGKSTFKRVGGGFEPTVQGELYMKEKFGVKKGAASQ